MADADPKIPIFADFHAMDSACMEILAGFYGWLQSPGGPSLDPAKASPLAHDADRYLRDFLTEIMELPASATCADTVRRYLGNWYIVNTLTPSREEIDRISRALVLFHEYAAFTGLVTRDTMIGVRRLLESNTRFHGRLESFWNLKPEEVTAWRAEDDYRKPANPGGTLQ